MSVTLPVPGFYYHAYHDPHGEVNNSAYEVVGVAIDRDTNELSVSYRALYPCEEHARGIMLFHQSLDKWNSPVLLKGESGGVMVPRFTHIKNPFTIYTLRKIRNKIHGVRLKPYC